ncbi:hypothetical protein DPMN_002623 [Dreissena polymorpha]|uniref:Uncharacterized protein n=1 Tax=Dreissena polymorpha TaxID=45954 RepID=A0A9D4MN78_DREPO|nr:hypothetical protein DPMN_002623 [Dreissena polymorpha]
MRSHAVCEFRTVCHIREIVPSDARQDAISVRSAYERTTEPSCSSGYPKSATGNRSTALPCAFVIHNSPSKSNGLD